MKGLFRIASSLKEKNMLVGKPHFFYYFDSPIEKGCNNERVASFESIPILIKMLIHVHVHVVWTQCLLLVF